MTSGCQDMSGVLCRLMKIPSKVQHVCVRVCVLALATNEYQNTHFLLAK